MENMEVINVEEMGVEPISTGVAEAVSNDGIGVAGGFVAGVVATAVAVVATKYVIKPVTKRIASWITSKKRKHKTVQVVDIPVEETANVTTVDFNEVEDTENE